MGIFNLVKAKNFDSTIAPKARWDYVALGLAAIMFFGIYLYLYISPSVLTLPLIIIEGKTEPAHLIFNQPDEMATYFFIRRLVLNNEFGYAEGLATLSNNQVHPRSTTVVHGTIAPIGFPGIIIIYSFILKILTMFFGNRFFNVFAVSLTPFIAAITPFFLYGWLRRIFDKPVALVSALLLFILPAWWYYASRPFQPNILFVFFLIVAGYLGSQWLASISGRRLYFGIGLGIIWALALYTRPSELIWIGAVSLILLILTRQRWVVRDWLGVLAGIILVSILFFATQVVFYGNPFSSGYVKPVADGSAGLVFSGPQGILFIKSLLLPFGFNLNSVLITGHSYFVHLFGGWHAIALAGLVLMILFAYKKAVIINWSYVILFFLMSGYLLVYYGSWLFADNILGRASIGSSQVRYFLPIYIFALPGISWLLIALYRRGKLGIAVMVCISFGLVFSSLFAVYMSFEGLIHIKRTVEGYYSWQNLVYKLTDKNSIIVTRYADKYLFPGRKIIAGLTDQERVLAITSLINKEYRVYWFDLIETEAKDSELLQKSNLTLSPVSRTWSGLELRRILRGVEKKLGER